MYPIQNQSSPIQSAALESLRTSALTEARSQLKERASSLVDQSGIESQLAGAAERFADLAFGTSVQQGQPQSELGALRSSASGASRNPLDMQRDLFMGSGQSRVSEGAESEGEEKGLFGRIADAIGGAATQAVGYVVDLVGPPGPWWSGVTGPSTVESVTGDSRDLVRGAEAFGRLSNGGYWREGMPDADTPNPEADDSSGPRAITAADLKALQARAGALVEPSGEASGSGGPVDGSQTPAGQLGALAQWADVGISARARSINALQLKGIEARLRSKIQ